MQGDKLKVSTAKLHSATIKLAASKARSRKKLEQVRGFVSIELYISLFLSFHLCRSLILSISLSLSFSLPLSFSPPLSLSLGQGCRTSSSVAKSVF